MTFYCYYYISRSTNLVSRGYWDPEESTRASAEDIVANDPTKLPAGETEVTQDNYFQIVSENRLGQTQPNQFQSSTDEQPTGWIWGSKCTAIGVCNESSARNNALAEMPRSYDNGGANSYGGYYNWYAATAESGTFAQTSGNATDSLCPKGWQLPKHSDSANLGWVALIAAYREVYATNTDLYYGLYSAPISFTTLGVYDGNSGTFISTNRSHYTTALPITSTNVNYMYIQPTGDASGLIIDPQHRDWNNKASGIFIRCVQRD